tara:strand:- start:368 stop:1048 length:681 start_codon:yes stop_codon:yes gene_type:complete
MKYTVNGFNNFGFINAKLSESDLAPIKTEINNIQNNFELYETQKHNKNLIGNIKKEYKLVESQKYIEELLMPLVGAYNNDFGYIKEFNILTNSVPIVLDDCWVNFQKKYEFNPAHNHSGIYSFVIWINVPYDMEEELKLSPGAEARSNLAGSFVFLYNDTTGKIKPFDILIDKNMENNIVFFPSNFYHMVYPFFSSDKYRVSVSGNFKLETGELVEKVLDCDVGLG